MSDAEIGGIKKRCEVRVTGIEIEKTEICFLLRKNYEHENIKNRIMSMRIFKTLKKYHRQRHNTARAKENQLFSVRRVGLNVAKEKFKNPPKKEIDVISQVFW